MIEKSPYRPRFIEFILLIYLATGVSLLYYLGYYTDSPDTVFYLTISKKYAQGQLFAAINNYWSPLISWLLIPFHLFGTDLLIGFKILQLIIGAGTLYAISGLSDSFIQNTFLKRVFILALFPTVLSYALLYQTPDLLFLLLLIILLKHLLNLLMNTTRGTSPGILAGALGALLFFAKSYGFPFFLASFSALACFVYVTNPSIRTLWIKRYLSGILTFLLLAGCWMGCLYIKYDTFSTGYASIYNFNLLGPDIYVPGKTNLQHPILANGLMDISSREEASAWESPGSLKQRSWSPFSSKKNALHYLNIIANNWKSFYYFIISRNTGLVFLIMLLLYFVSFKKQAKKMNLTTALVITYILIYTGGYSLVFFMPRYLWITGLLMLLLIFHMAENSYSENKFLRYPVLLLLATALFFQIKKPVKEILFKSDTDSSISALGRGLLHPAETLTTSYHNSMAFPLLKEKINALHLTAGRVAGIRTADQNYFSYTQTLLLCMYSGHTFFGELQHEPTTPESILPLQQFKIDYLYCWEPLLHHAPGSQLLMEDVLTGFQLYKLR